MPGAGGSHHLKHIVSGRKAHKWQVESTTVVYKPEGRVGRQRVPAAVARKAVSVTCAARAHIIHCRETEGNRVLAIRQGYIVNIRRGDVEHHPATIAPPRHHLAAVEVDRGQNRGKAYVDGRRVEQSAVGRSVQKAAGIRAEPHPTLAVKAHGVDARGKHRPVGQPELTVLPALARRRVDAQEAVGAGGIDYPLRSDCERMKQCRHLHHRAPRPGTQHVSQQHRPPAARAHLVKHRVAPCGQERRATVTAPLVAREWRALMHHPAVFAVFNNPSGAKKRIYHPSHGIHVLQPAGTCREPQGKPSAV